METDDEYFETKVELNMTIDDIRNEPPDSERIPRCKKCRRMCFAHDGPTGVEKCKLDPIEDQQTLQEDDEKVNKIREKERLKKCKRKNISDSEDLRNSTVKKSRTDEPEAKNILPNEVNTDKEIETLEAKLKKKEEETSRLKKRLQEEEEKQAKYYGGAKSKTTGRRTRSRSQSYRKGNRERSKRRSKSSSREHSSYRNDRYRDNRYRGREYSRNEYRYDDHMQYNRKIVDPPVWGKLDTFSGWKRRVIIWNEEKDKPERKANALIESMMKNEHHKGIIEYARQAVVENEHFDWKRKDVVLEILKIMEDEVEDSMWTKNMNACKELLLFKNKAGENELQFIQRFANLEILLKNAKSNISNTFMACFFIQQSNLDQVQKENVLSSINLNNDKTVLTEIKKKYKMLKASVLKADEGEKVTLFGSFKRGRSKSKQRNFDSRIRSKSGSRMNNDRYNRDRSYSRGRYDSRERRDRHRSKSYDYGNRQ